MRWFNVCSSCQFKWEESEDENFVLDAHGSKLYDGDSIVIKDLKVRCFTNFETRNQSKQYSYVDGDHNIDCKILILET